MHNMKKVLGILAINNNFFNVKIEIENTEQFLKPTNVLT